MFRFVKRLKQITGFEPLERMHLGQYSYKESFQVDNVTKGKFHFSKVERINTDIYLNAFESKSFTISIIDRFKVQEFHLIRMPIEEDGYDVYPVMNDDKIKYVIAIKNNSAYIRLIDLMIGIKYFN